MAIKKSEIINVRENEGTWAFLFPITKLVLTDAVKFEFKVDRVTFVSTDKLPRRRKKFGLPEHISELRRNKNLFWLNDFISKSDTFATLRQTGKLKDIEQLVLEKVREELSILTLSQLGYARRSNMARPYISDENSMSSTSYYATNLESGYGSQPNRALGTPHPLFLDFRWKKFNKKNGFFFDLLKILRGEIKVEKHWKRDLRNAAILVGLSQNSLDLPQAFLNNMIALILLPTKTKRLD